MLVFHRRQRGETGSPAFTGGIAWSAAMVTVVDVIVLAEVMPRYSVALVMAMTFCAALSQRPGTCTTVYSVSKRASDPALLSAMT